MGAAGSAAPNADALVRRIGRDTSGYDPQTLVAAVSPMPSMMTSKGPRHLRSSFCVLVRWSCFSALLVCTALRLNRDHHLSAKLDITPGSQADQPMSAAVLMPRMWALPAGMRCARNQIQIELLML